MRILMTGVTGYLGGWIYQKLAKAHEVVATVRPGASPSIGGPTVEWDLTEPLPRTLPVVDAVVHAAQSREYSRFPEGGLDTFAVNCGSTARLLDFAASNGVRHFCLISSGSVYEPYDSSLEEDVRLSPSSLNGTSKLAAELLTHPYESYLKISRLRLFFPYGPGQTARMIPNLIDRVSSGATVTLAGENGIAFAPLHARDIARITYAAVTEGWEGNYNLSGPEIVHMREFAGMISDSLGEPAHFERVAGDAPIIAPTCNKLKSVYRVSSLVGVREGLAEVIKEAQRR